MSWLILFAIVLFEFGASASKLKPACELKLVAIPTTRRQFVMKTPFLPYLQGDLTVENIGMVDGKLGLALIPRGGDSVEFSVSGLLDFWLNEIIYRRELNLGLKVRTVLYGRIFPNLPRRIPLITIDEKYAAIEDAEKLLRGFLADVTELNLVTYNWRLELSSITLIKFLRGLPTTERYRDSELLEEWDKKLPGFYESLRPSDRLLLGRNFFDPRLSLSQDERLIHAYLFQGNTREESAAIERLRAKIARFFAARPQHEQILPAIPFKPDYFPGVLSPEVRVLNNRYLSDSPKHPPEPKHTIADLVVSDSLHARLKGSKYLVPEQLMGESAEDVAKELNLSRNELVELAHALFQERVFLYFKWTWDYRFWRILKEYPYLQCPQRALPRINRKYIPISNHIEEDY